LRTKKTEAEIGSSNAVLSGLDGAYYRNVLLSQQLLPAVRQISGKFFIFQQDSPPAHGACDTINLLERDTPAFISPDLWPLNSPDLNLVDGVWGVMHHRIYQTKVKNLDDMKRRLIDVWAGIQQSLIDDAINQWRKRLCACVLARSGHFEHSLLLSHQSDCEL